MTTWTEAQIDRHLHLWEHRHGPDSPEAGIVRQLRAERERAQNVLRVARRTILEGGSGGVTCTVWVPYDISPAETLVDHIDAALPTTQETPHE